ncbi:MAG TPA: DMT family transporter [Acidimicrobiia bacterium]
MNPWTPLAGATLGWAAGSVLTRAVLVRGVSTWTMIPLRMGFALLSLLAVIVATRRFWTLDPVAWRKGVVLGGIAMALPMVLMTLAFEDLPVSVGGLLIALVPLATIGAAHFLVETERFQARSLPGLLLALAGSALLVGLGGSSVEGVGDLWRGVLLMLGGVVMAGVGGALSRRYALEVPSNDLVLPQFSVNTVIVTLVLPVFFDFQIETIDTAGWWMIAGIGALGTTLAFGSFLVAAGLNPAYRLAYVGYAIPVLSVVLAIIFLGESLTPAIVIGAAMILTGVVLAERTTTHVPEPGVATAR